MLGERGIKPEELPPTNDTKKLERRAKTQEKQLIENAGKFSEEGLKKQTLIFHYIFPRIILFPPFSAILK